MKSITSDANPNFRRWLRIAGAPRVVREEGQTLAEGVHLAQAALAAAVPVAAVLLRKGAAHPELDALLAQLPAAAARFELASALYERIAPVEQGAGLTLVLAVPETAPPQGVRADMVYLDAGQRRRTHPQCCGRRRAPRARRPGHGGAMGAEGAARRHGRAFSPRDPRARAGGAAAASARRPMVCRRGPRCALALGPATASGRHGLDIRRRGQRAYGRGLGREPASSLHSHQRRGRVLERRGSGGDMPV
jgi:hypothetical protein